MRIPHFLRNRKVRLLLVATLLAGLLALIAKGVWLNYYQQRPELDTRNLVTISEVGVITQYNKEIGQLLLRNKRVQASLRVQSFGVGAVCEPLPITLALPNGVVVNTVAIDYSGGKERISTRQLTERRLEITLPCTFLPDHPILTISLPTGSIRLGLVSYIRSWLLIFAQ